MNIHDLFFCAQWLVFGISVTALGIRTVYRARFSTSWLRRAITRLIRRFYATPGQLTNG